jgi:hypothetical protein
MRRLPAGEVEHHFIHVTPPPRVGRKKRFHDGMTARVEMFGGVLVLRRIAAADVAARKTQPEVNPRIAHFQAFLAAFLIRVRDLDLVGMFACRHR